MQNILDMTAADLGRSIAKGRLDPVEITQAYLDAAQNHSEIGRVYTMLTTDRALSEAVASSLRAKSCQRLSPLDGVPISWKDLFDTSGLKTEAGSDLLSGRLPKTDAKCLKNYSTGVIIDLYASLRTRKTVYKCNFRQILQVLGRLE